MMLYHTVWTLREECLPPCSSRVIEEVKEPTEWCTPMVPFPKKSEEVRICADLKWLNMTVKRKRFILPTIDGILPQLEESYVFSLLDAASGFLQIPLESETAKLTTFITPMERYFTWTASSSMAGMRWSTRRDCKTIWGSWRAKNSWTTWDIA